MNAGTETYLPSRPVQIQAVHDPAEDGRMPCVSLYSLCEDGSIWMMFQDVGSSGDKSGPWRMIQPPAGFRYAPEGSAKAEVSSMSEIGYPHECNPFLCNCEQRWEPTNTCGVCGVQITTGELCGECAKGNDPFDTTDRGGDWMARDIRRGDAS